MILGENGVRKLKIASRICLAYLCMIINVRSACAAENNELKACVDGELSLSVKCVESDEIDFLCDDSVTFSYSGYSSVSIGDLKYYSKSYVFKFGTMGVHEITLLVNGETTIKREVQVYERHNYIDEVIKRQPTCTQNGEKQFTCENCGATKKELIPATGHSYGPEVVYAATCTKDGKIVKKCEVCQREESEKIKKLGHDYQKKVVAKEPTCVTNGYKLVYCTRCDAKSSKREIIYAAGHHTYADEMMITDKPTCEECGYKCLYCVKCGYKTSEEEIPALGHRYGNWVCKSKATIFNEAYYQRTCNVCGNVDDKYGKKLKSSVTLKKRKIKIRRGTHVIIKIKKKHKQDKIRSWVSTNKKVVKISRKSGRITAMKKGKAKVTVTMKSGCKATCIVVVK